MARLEDAGLVVLVLFVIPFAATALLMHIGEHRASQRWCAARLGLVYMAPPRGRRRGARAPRDYPVRRRPSAADVQPQRGFWDGSCVERTLVDCADGCDTKASAEFGDHGGACLSAVPRNLVIPHSGLGLVRALAHRQRDVLVSELLYMLRLHRPVSQSHVSVCHFALAIAIERRWIEPVDGDPGQFRSLLWALSPAEAAARSSS